MIVDSVGNPTDRKTLQRFATVIDAYRSMAVNRMGRRTRSPVPRDGAGGCFMVGKEFDEWLT
jgi:hypothetical protein